MGLTWTLYLCFCMWEAVRIFHVTYMKNFLDEWKPGDSEGVGDRSDRCIVFYFREEITGRTLKSKRKSELGAVAG